jgi:uncharacterized membrane protein
MFAHVGGLVVAGGAAIEADRVTLRRAAWSGRRTSAFEPLSTVHQTVLVSLTVVVVSGVLLFAADVDTYLHSSVYWTKMALLALLLLNGMLMLRAERRIGSGDHAGWSALLGTARASVALWTLTLLAGVALPNLG